MSKSHDMMSWLLVAFVLLLVGAAAYFVMEPKLRPHVSVQLGGTAFSARIASTEEEKTRGLSGTASLAENEAMLFVYDRDDKWSIWMKDMRYPIDIVWLDKDKKVVHIVKNAPPESYPYESFASKEEARYVLELAAGTTAKRSIIIGAQAIFDENRIEGLKL
jgi:uncharacterized protein